MNDRWRDRLWQALRGGADRREVLLGLALPAASLSLLSSEQSKAKKRRNRNKKRRPTKTPLKVMSRNIYLGADLSPLFAVTTIEQLIAADTAMFAIVQETDFPARAKLLAAEIMAEEPHIIGLQEVSL